MSYVPPYEEGNFPARRQPLPSLWGQDAQDRPPSQRTLQQKAPEDVVADPFLTKHGGYGSFGPSVKGQSEQKPSRRASAVEAIPRWLGPGDPERTVRELNLLVWIPSICFAAVTAMWCVLRRISMEVCAILSAVAIAGCLGIFFAGWRRLLRFADAPRLSLVVLASLGLLAVLSGIVVGIQGWELYWRQISWSSTGGFASGASASTPAAALQDAATIDFRDPENVGQTRNLTSVDSSRSAGYKDVHTYCVAPVMDHETAASDYALVNVWAVGIDCCQPSGSFLCDGSRDPSAGYGLVMLPGGFPCPSCNEEQFRRAVQKAEETYQLVSAAGAVFVRWTSSPTQLRLQLLLGGVIFILSRSALAFLVFMVLGGSFWYFGLGANVVTQAEAEKRARETILKP